MSRLRRRAHPRQGVVPQPPTDTRRSLREYSLSPRPRSLLATSNPEVRAPMRQFLPRSDEVQPCIAWTPPDASISPLRNRTRSRLTCDRRKGGSSPTEVRFTAITKPARDAQREDRGGARSCSTTAGTSGHIVDVGKQAATEID